MSLLVYRSSAGSGKTFTLVKEYLVEVFRSESAQSFRKLQALTFTNKAANEMKVRIIHALHRFANSNEVRDDLLAAVLAELPNSTPSQIKKRSSELLEQILTHYYLFSVSTIDKFNLKVIRSFAREMKLSEDYEVVIDSKEFLIEAVDRLFLDMDHDSTLRKFLHQFTLHQVDQDKNWKIKNTLYEFSEIIISEKSRNYLSLLERISLTDLNQLINTIRSRKKTIEDQFQAVAKEFLQLANSFGLEHDHFKGKSKGGILKYFQQQAAQTQPKIPTDSQLAIFEDQNWWNGNIKGDQLSELQQYDPQIKEVVIRLMELLGDPYDEYSINELIARNIYQLGLLRSIYERFEQIKKEKKILPISDFNHLISSIVENEPAPFIYERIGNRFEHFLIDEFQDTSKLQWRNLLPLFQESLAKGKKNLLVGDAKQAIYRWRGGDIDQFVRLYSPTKDPILNERLRALESHHEDRFLDSNYRSAPEIVNFNNELFRLVAQNNEGSISEVFNLCEQQAIKNDPKGFVRIEKHQRGEIDLETWNLNRILHFIEDLIDRGYHLGEIAILTRNNKELALIAEFLVDNKVPIVSSEALLAINDLQVQLFHSILEFSETDQDQFLVKIALIQSQLSRFAELDHDPSIISKLKGLKEKATFLADLGIQIDLSELYAAPIQKKIRLILSALDFDLSINAHLRAYLDLVYQLDRKHKGDIKQVLLKLRESLSTLSISTLENSGAVQLLTIHKSKGLEFPVVLMPFANKTMKTESIWVELNEKKFGIPVSYMSMNKKIESTSLEPFYTAEKEKQKLDTLNVFYVAFTRAVEALFVLLPEKPASNQTASFILDELDSLSGWNEERTVFMRGELSVKKNNQEDKIESQLKRESTGASSEDIFNFENIPLENDEIRYGNLLHGLMQTVNKQNWLDYLNDMLITKGIDQKLHEKLRKDFTAYFENSEHEFLFDKKWRVYAERKLHDGKGNILRPDRVITHRNEAVVLDYKTGEANAKDLKQVKGYVHSLNMMGFTEVSGYLYYTKNKELVKA